MGAACCVVVVATTPTNLIMFPTSAIVNFIGAVRSSASLATLKLKNIPANETVNV